MIEQLRHHVASIAGMVRSWLSTPDFYVQAAIVVGALALAYAFAPFLLAQTRRLERLWPEERFAQARRLIFAARDLLRPALIVALLATGAIVADAVVGQSWVVRLAQSLAIAFLIYAAIKRFIANATLRSAATWIGVPAAVLWAFGYLDEALVWLDSVAISAGNIRISVLFLAKAAAAGGFFFWLGRRSNDYGQQLIHRQEGIDPPTRELFGKMFEIAVFGVIVVLLLQVLGLDLTALAIFGGALGVGLGFGLQQIASNFISGIILLLERSMGAGDYIELADGRAGVLSKVHMRSSVLKTFDGKEIMVPNEQFITTRFVNWTRADPHQRYEVAFNVPYDVDLKAVRDIVTAAVARDTRVLQAPEPPQTEIRRFGEFRIALAAVFWVDGLDDGPNRFSSDIAFLIWEALSAAGIPMTAKFSA
ncbi:MAG: mechanosensitive ion channel [Phyllobacteriaceae bacterium]|nr:mechanosensitive ion channel [Phyllobacteriaceae bacterium]